MSSDTISSTEDKPQKPQKPRTNLRRASKLVTFALGISKEQKKLKEEAARQKGLLAQTNVVVDGGDMEEDELPVQVPTAELAKESLQSELFGDPEVNSSTFFSYIIHPKPSTSPSAAYQSMSEPYTTVVGLDSVESAKLKHPIFSITIITPTSSIITARYRFKDFRSLHRSFLGSLKKWGINERFFPKTYRKSSLGIGLSDRQLGKRAVILSSWISRVVESCGTMEEDQRYALLQFLDPEGMVDSGGEGTRAASILQKWWRRVTLRRRNKIANMIQLVWRRKLANKELTKRRKEERLRPQFLTTFEELTGRRSDTAGRVRGSSAVLGRARKLTKVDKEIVWQGGKRIPTVREHKEMNGAAETIGDYYIVEVFKVTTTGSAPSSGVTSEVLEVCFSGVLNDIVRTKTVRDNDIQQCFGSMHNATTVEMEGHVEKLLGFFLLDGDVDNFVLDGQGRSGFGGEVERQLLMEGVKVRECRTAAAAKSRKFYQRSSVLFVDGGNIYIGASKSAAKKRRQSINQGLESDLGSAYKLIDIESIKVADENKKVMEIAHLDKIELLAFCLADVDTAAKVVKILEKFRTNEIDKWKKTMAEKEAGKRLTLNNFSRYASVGERGNGFAGGCVNLNDVERSETNSTLTSSAKSTVSSLTMNTLEEAYGK